MEHKKLQPLYFFLSLGTLVSLIATVTAFLNLAFETLNHALPDVLTDTYQYGYATYSYEGVRTALSVLIIMLPVYLVLERAWRKRSEHIDGWNTTLRKWAIYLILFLASITIISDLVILVRYFVSGEITLRFLIKVGVTLLIAGKVGFYYVRSISHTLTLLIRRMYMWCWGVLALGLIIWSFSVIGSPLAQRSLRLDQRRIDDLQNIQWQVIGYWQQKQTLPQSLADLSTPISSYRVPEDPEFQKGKMYEYRVIVPDNVRLTLEGMRSLKTFELCATFDRALPKGWVPNSGGGVAYPMTATRDAAVSIAPYPGASTDAWDHDAGRACFTRTIDPDLYPPFPKPVKE